MKNCDNLERLLRDIKETEDITIFCFRGYIEINSTLIETLAVKLPLLEMLKFDQCSFIEEYFDFNGFKHLRDLVVRDCTNYSVLYKAVNAKYINNIRLFTSAESEVLSNLDFVNNFPRLFSLDITGFSHVFVKDLLNTLYNIPLTYLSILNKNINAKVDIESFQGFKFLNKIRIDNANIESLEVFKDVPYLEDLRLNHPCLISLKGLELLSYLKVLSFKGLKEDIKDFVFPYLPLLYRVNCEDSHITKLDCKEAISLSFLEVPNNKLTEIDVEGLPSISRINAANNLLSSFSLKTSSGIGMELVLLDNPLKTITLSEYNYNNRNFIRYDSKVKINLL